jgi:hypothetical protein
MAQKIITMKDVERSGIRGLRGMTLHGKEFRLLGVIPFINNDDEIPQTKGIVALRVIPRSKGYEVLSAAGDGIFTFQTEDCKREFTIDRAGIYDINGKVIYQPHEPGIVNLFVFLTSSHNETIHTYRTPPNIIIIHAPNTDRPDCGVKVNVDGAHRTTPDNYFERKSHDLRKYSYGHPKNPQEEDFSLSDSPPSFPRNRRKVSQRSAVSSALQKSDSPYFEEGQEWRRSYSPEEGTIAYMNHKRNG